MNGRVFLAVISVGEICAYARGNRVVCGGFAYAADLWSTCADNERGKCPRPTGIRRRFEARWQAWLTDDEPPEVAFYCRECAEREFKNFVHRQPLRLTLGAAGDDRDTFR